MEISGFHFAKLGSTIGSWISWAKDVIFLKDKSIIVEVPSSTFFENLNYRIINSIVIDTIPYFIANITNTTTFVILKGASILHTFTNAILAYNSDFIYYVNGTDIYFIVTNVTYNTKNTSFIFKVSNGVFVSNGNNDYSLIDDTFSSYMNSAYFNALGSFNPTSGFYDYINKSTTCSISSNSGRLISGLYSVYLKHNKNTVSHSNESNIIPIGNVFITSDNKDLGTVTNKSINLTFNFLTTGTYTIYIVYNKTTAYSYEYTCTTAGISTIIITDTVNFETVLLTDITVPKIDCYNANTVLIQGNKLRYTKSANSTLYTKSYIYNTFIKGFIFSMIYETKPLFESYHKSTNDNYYNDLREDITLFQPGEVYELSVRLFDLKGYEIGTYHIPGRAMNAYDTNISNSSLFGAFNYTSNRYSVVDYDKATSSNTTNYRHQLEHWQNKNQTYDSSYGYLSGGNVRHHKIPTIAGIDRDYDWDCNNYGSYMADIATGISTYKALAKVPRLMFEIDFNLCDSDTLSLRSNISRFEILYTKRTFDNSIIIDEGLLSLTGYAPVENDTAVNNAKFTYHSLGTASIGDTFKATDILVTRENNYTIEAIRGAGGTLIDYTVNPPSGESDGRISTPTVNKIHRTMLSNTLNAYKRTDLANYYTYDRVFNITNIKEVTATTSTQEGIVLTTDELYEDVTDPTYGYFKNTQHLNAILVNWKQDCYVNEDKDYIVAGSFSLYANRAITTGLTYTNALRANGVLDGDCFLSWHSFICKYAPLSSNLTIGIDHLCISPISDKLRLEGSAYSQAVIGITKTFDIPAYLTANSNVLINYYNFVNASFQNNLIQPSIVDSTLTNTIYTSDITLINNKLSIAKTPVLNSYTFTNNKGSIIRLLHVEKGIIVVFDRAIYISAIADTLNVSGVDVSLKTTDIFDTDPINIFVDIISTFNKDCAIVVDGILYILNNADLKLYQYKGKALTCLSDDSFGYNNQILNKGYYYKVYPYPGGYNVKRVCLSHDPFNDRLLIKFSDETIEALTTAGIAVTDTRYSRFCLTYHIGLSMFSGFYKDSTPFSYAKATNNHLYLISSTTLYQIDYIRPNSYTSDLGFVDITFQYENTVLLDSIEFDAEYINEYSGYTRRDNSKCPISKVVVFTDNACSKEITCTILTIDSSLVTTGNIRYWNGKWILNNLFDAIVDKSTITNANFITQSTREISYGDTSIFPTSPDWSSLNNFIGTFFTIRVYLDITSSTNKRAKLNDVKLNTKKIL